MYSRLRRYRHLSRKTVSFAMLKQIGNWFEPWQHR